MRGPGGGAILKGSMEVSMHTAPRRPRPEPADGTARRAWRRFPALLLGMAMLVDAGAASAWLRRPDPPDIPAVQSLRVTPLPAGSETAAAEVFGLLTTPTHWDAGDAAVVLVGVRFPSGPLQGRLVEALLGEGAAVLELDTDAARGASVDSGDMPAPPEALSLLPDLFGALLALRRDHGAGIVVVIGLEEAGEAALRAANAEDRLPAGMTGFAAGIDLGPDGAQFGAGAPLPAAERWEARVPPLCEVLAGSVTAPPPGLARRCVAALGGGPAPALVGLRMGTAAGR
jgi:hypothetical protein